MMMSDETFNNIKKCIEFVVLLYVSYWILILILILIYLILDSHTHLIQLNQFRDSNYANAVTQKIKNHLIFFF